MDQVTDKIIKKMVVRFGRSTIVFSNYIANYMERRRPEDEHIMEQVRELRRNVADFKALIDGMEEEN